MANFGDITGKVRSRSLKFAKRIEQFVEKHPIIFGLQTPSVKAVISATAKFLAGFGSEVVRLNRISRDRLAAQDAVARSAMRDRAIAEVTANTKSELKEIVDSYSRGRIDLGTLRTNTQAALRRSAIAAAVVGAGGVGGLTENVLTAVQRQLSAQFQLLDGFINELSTRELTQRDRARFQLYANSAHTVAQTANRQFSLDTYGDIGLEERRVLGGSEHCEDCVALAAEGWVQAGTLPAIGHDTVCGNSCRCTIITRPIAKNNEQSQPVPEADGGS